MANHYEGWSYVPAGSNEKYDPKEKVFEAIGYCRDKGTTFVREDFFNYEKLDVEKRKQLEEGLLVIEEKKKGISSLLIPGIVKKGKIYPALISMRGEILSYLNRDNIDGGGKTMKLVFWNIELEARGNNNFRGSPNSL